MPEMYPNLVNPVRLKIDTDLTVSALKSLMNEVYSPDKLDLKSRVSAGVLDFVKFFLQAGVKDIDPMSFDDFCGLKNDELTRVLQKMIDYLKSLEVVKLELSCELDNSIISRVHAGLAEMIHEGNYSNGIASSAPEADPRNDGIVLDVTYNAGLIGGLTFAYKGKYFDYSLKSAIHRAFYDDNGNPVLEALFNIQKEKI